MERGPLAGDNRCSAGRRDTRDWTHKDPAIAASHSADPEGGRPWLAANNHERSKGLGGEGRVPDLVPMVRAAISRAARRLAKAVFFCIWAPGSATQIATQGLDSTGLRSGFASLDLDKIGAPERSRTPNPQIRSLW
jgi:hypothetical protein